MPDRSWPRWPRNVDWLIAGRVVMGVGAAASEPGTLSIIRHVYPDGDPGRRARRVGGGLGPGPGPRAGHRRRLVGFSSWRAIFWFNLGFGVVAFVMAAVAVPETSDRQGRRIDVLGVRLRRRVPGLRLVRGDPGGGVRLHRTWWIVALFVAVRPCPASRSSSRRNRVKSPMLDLSMFRRPPFAGSNFVAFAAYFGTFSIFFFTALYLQVVANASAYQTAVDFLPMAAGLIIASALTGPLGGAHRAPLADDHRLRAGRRRHPAGQPRARAPRRLRHPRLGAAHRRASGSACCWCPVTSVPLTVVPPERSGMAASATNTSREMGAVFGVAILGAIVNAKLTGDLAARLKAIGIPPSFQSLVAPRRPDRWRLAAAVRPPRPNTPRTRRSPRSPPRWSNAAYDAFGSGLHEALLLSGLPDPGGRRRWQPARSTQAGGDLRDLAASRCARLTVDRPGRPSENGRRGRRDAR